ncbi:MAG: hypothetical protein QOI10_1010, partial [Solirubrobacterales bacterium]|nr:hypothetical protein [Solirubrobacterales bacterium]
MCASGGGRLGAAGTRRSEMFNRSIFRFNRALTGLIAVAIAAAIAGTAIAAIGGPTPERELGFTCFGQAPTISGTAGDDHLSGTGDADVILGLGGDDTITGAGAGDSICGGGGDDRISGQGAADQLNGGRDNDTLSGGSGPDRLRGRRGDDTLTGDAGDDQLGGGPGTDNCDGGSGHNRTRACETPTQGGGGGDNGNGGGGGGGGEPQNHDPKANDDTDTTDEATAKSVDVLANDTDADGDTLKVQSLGTGSTQGTVTITGSGSAVNYDPNGHFESLGAGATATDSFNYVVKDGNGGTDTATATITITGIDDPPVALADQKTLTEDDPATQIDVLANDTDPDGGPKTVDSKTNGAHGTVAITGGGSGLTYAPDPNFCGIDSFTYTLNGGSSTTVTVNVTCVDDPGVTAGDSATVGEDSGANPIDVLANDTDPDGGQVSSITQPAHGSAAITGGGTGVSYTPNSNFCSPPPDTFTYTVPGGSTATVTVTVSCINDAPVNSVPAAQSTNEDTNLVLTGGNAISVSDSDASPGNLQVTLTATHGTLTAGGAFAGNGTSTVTATATQAAINAALASVTYSPAANYNGAASIAVDTSDLGNTGSGGTKTDSDTIAITVNAVDDPGTANPDSPAVNEDSGANTINVLANDTDVDGGSLVQSVTQPAHGTVAITNGGADLTYTPNSNFCSAPTDPFDYTLNNGASTATVTVTVNCQNDAPVNTVPGAQSTNEDTNLVLSGGNAISVSDVDAAPGSLQVTLTATHGAVTLSGTSGLAFSVGDGTADPTMTFTGTLANLNSALNGLTFAPTPTNYNGPATLQIVTDDQGNTGAGGAQSDTDSVAIAVNAVNDAPVAVPDSKTVNEDAAATTIDVIANDTDVDASPNTITGVTQPPHGTVVNNGSDLTYQPNANYCNDGPPTDDFSYTLNGGSNTNVAVTVNCQNDAPVNTVPGAQSTNEDTNLVLSGGNAISVSDVDAAPGSLQVTLNATHGLVTLSGTAGLAFSVGDGTADPTMTFTGTQANLNSALNGLTFAPTPADYNGPATLQIVTNDQGNSGAGGAQSDTDSVAIAVNAVNDAPDVDLNGGGGGNDSTATFNESNPHTGTGVLIAPAAQITDPDDANIESMTVTLPVRPDGDSFESLSAMLALPAPISGSYVAATGTLAFTGSATKADYESVLQSIRYDNTKNPPNPADRTITVVANDGDNNSISRDAVVHVVPINAAPVVDLDSVNGASNDSSAAFVEGGGPVSLAPNPTVTDADVGDNTESAEIKITNLQDNTAESLSVTLSSGITIVGGSYNSATGILALTGSATPAQYATVLATVKYDNSSDTPGTTARAVTFKVNDGQADSVVRTSTVSVTPTNDPPVVDLNGTATGGINTTAAFTEDGGPITLAGLTDVSDPDNASLASATVTLTNRPDGALESLSADVTGTSIIADAYVPGTGVLFLHGSDTLARYQQVLRTVKYNNTDQDPDATSRAVTFKANDGSADSATATATTTITVVNDAPGVDLNGGGGGIDSNAAFIEDSSPANPGSGAVSLAPSGTVTDVDNANTNSATITLTNHPDAASESLSVNTAGTSVTATGNNSHQITLSVSRPKSEYQTVLQTLKYNNTSNTPDTTSRDVTVKVNDGALDSPVAHSTITVAATNDAPVADDELFTGTDKAVGNTSLVVNDPTDVAPSVADPKKSISGDILAGDTDADNSTSGFTVGPTGAQAITSQDGGKVTLEADGDFTFFPKAGTSCTDTQDQFDYTLHDNDGTDPETDTGTVKIDIANCVWYADNSLGSNGTGTSSSPFNTLGVTAGAGLNGASGAGDSDSAGDTIFLFQGSGSYTGGLPLENTQTLVSQRAGLSVGGSPIFTATGNNATIANAAGNALTLASGNSIQG